ncbi:MAG TPA: DnaJ domain-containing protein [Arenimonas sp.]|nr:DnaJ domain-containing protein [Arenimonas sp.]
MRYYGKLLGFVAGWLVLRHPGGGVLGALVGHAFDADWFFARKPKSDPYAVLGVEPQASDHEVEQAYRRLITQYHPDRLQGAADELREQAEQRARELNAAYESIQKQRRAR